MLNKYSKGKIKCNLFIEGTVGGDIEILEGVRIGILDISFTGMIPKNYFTKEYGFLNFPFIFKDFHHFYIVWNSTLGEKAQMTLIKNNIRPLDIYYSGFRLITSNKPIKTVSDMKDLKIRIPQNPGWDKIFESFKSTAYALSLSELYKSISTGITEASEGPASQVNSYKLYEIQKYLILSEHQISSGIICINEKKFASLDRECQTITKIAAIEAAAYASEYAMNSEKGIIKNLEAKGMVLISPDKESFRQKAKTVIDELFKTEWNVTSWEEINKM